MLSKNIVTFLRVALLAASAGFLVGLFKHASAGRPSSSLLHVPDAERC